MRHGDFLIFNSSIPHCISTRCREEDNVIAVTMYLKTAVVGLNNNSIPLTTQQVLLSEKYREMSKQFY